MPTINQLVRKGRERAAKKPTAPILQGTDAQEAQFRSAENRENPPDELHRRYLLYPGYRPQPAGAQRCAYPRRPCAGSARCSLPHHPRCSGYRRCGEADAGSFPVWRKAPEEVSLSLPTQSERRREPRSFLRKFFGTGMTEGTTGAGAAAGLFAAGTR